MTAVVSDVKKDLKTVNPPKLFDLTSLQREANKKYGYTAQQTLTYLQSLYEKKLATYPRTDSQYLTEDMEQSTLEVIQCIGEVMPFGVVDMPNLSRSINNKKVTGHHAIIPTSRIKSEKIDDLPTGEKNILSLISLRLLCAVSEPHKYESVKIIVTCEGNIFTASGRTIVDMGWKSIDAKIENSDKSEQGQDESQLPDIEKGMTFEKVPAKKSVHFTSPPKSFTDVICYERGIRNRP